MKTHLVVSRWLAVVALCVMFLSMPAAATSLTPEQMYLAPTTVPSAVYDYDYYAPGYAAAFSNVTNLQVLPALTSYGGGYYFRPGIDYTGDITGTNGTITFAHSGPYFVLATYTDKTTRLFDYGIGFLTRNGGETYNWSVIPTPAPDVVITDPNPYPNPNPPPATLTLPPSNPDFPAGTTEVNNLQTWAEVLTYLKSLSGTNLHVELGGHGSTGAFYWNGTSIPASDFAQLKGKVSYLTFMSCETGAGSCAYLTEIAGYLGAAGGYTDVVGGDGHEWFINGEGTFKKIIPEPVTMLGVFLGVSCLAGYIRRRKLAA